MAETISCILESRNETISSWNYFKEVSTVILYNEAVSTADTKTSKKRFSKMLLAEIRLTVITKFLATL